MDLSIVIVNWNVRGYLERCLRSVYAHTAGLSFEVIVVDNASSDASAEMVSGAFPQVQLIRSGRNLGFAGGNNLGLRAARGKYSLLLNPDTELTDNSLKALVEYMESHPDVDCAAPRLNYGDGSLQHSCRHFPTLFTDLMESLCLDGLFPDSRFFNRYKMGMWAHDREQEVDQPFGACLLFRSQDLARLGYMDERFFMYYDEVDLCYRLKKTGGKIMFLPSVSVTHHANRSSVQAVSDCERWKTQSKMMFYRKHYGAAGTAGLYIGLWLNYALVYGVFTILHALTGRPRDLAYFKALARARKQAYGEALRQRR